MSDRLHELLNAELDGELDGAGRAELERLLAASPEARARREELRRVVEALAHIAPVEPPSELKDALFAAVRPAASKVVQFRGAKPQRRWAPYVGALAAGVALGAIGLSLYHAPRDGFDAASLAGTMADRDRPAAGRLLDTVRIDGEAVEGTATLEEVDGLWVVELDLTTDRPVEVVASYDGTLVRLQGFVRPEATSEAVRAGPGQLSFINDGAQRAAIYLRPADAASGQVRLVFSAPGAQTREALLDAGQVPGR